MSDREKQKPSIVDVAKIAGVSAGTVSRVINSNPKISPATVRRVVAAMDEAGYQPPHPTRRRGKSSRAQQGIHSSQIALIPGTGASFVYTPHLTRAWQAVRNALDSEDLAMVIVPVTNLARAPSVIDPKQTDGLLLEPGSLSTQPLHPVASMPAVMMFTPRPSDEERGSSWFDAVVPDNREVGNLALRSLLNRGVTRLAYFNPNPRSMAFRVRGEGFRDAASEQGLIVTKIEAPPPDAKADLDSRRDSAEQFVEYILDEENGIAADGIFVPNDLDTCLVQVELLRRNVIPGRDLHLISCGAEETILSGLFPRPPSIDLQPDMIGERAVAQLIWRMANRDKPGGARITVPPRLPEPSA